MPPLSRPRARRRIEAMARAQSPARDFIDIVGASGVTYRFRRLRDAQPLSPMGGNYLYGRFEGDHFEVACAGEASNLLRDAHARWAEAVERHFASELFS